MAPTQPRRAAQEEYSVSSSLSRSSGISKSRESPCMSVNGPRPHMTEPHVHMKPTVPQPQSHATVRGKQTSSRVTPSTQISQALQLPSSSSQQLSTSASTANTGDAGPPIYIPKVRHGPHPDSKLCQDFHWIPYPLGLMPYESWHSMHHRPSPAAKHRFRCPVCYQERIATAHARKVFLVAERLTWNDTTVSSNDRALNEELNWAVNYEVGILEPCVEDGTQLPGGRNSQENQFYPYRNEHEMRLALKVVFMMDELTPATWALWSEAQMSFQKLLDGEEPGSNEARSGKSHTIARRRKDAAPVSGKSPELVEMIDLTGSPEPESTRQLGTPSSLLRRVGMSSDQPKMGLNGFSNHQNESSSIERPQPSEGIHSYKTLQDFYSLLDKIERTSYVGALFLEAYAEKLRDDMCKSCWLRHNVQLDLF